MAKLDIEKIKQELNLPDVTDHAIEDALRGAGITSQAGAMKWAQSNRGPSQPGAIGNLRHNTAHAWDDLAGWLTDSLHSAPAKPKEKPKPKAAGETDAQKAAAQQKAYQAQIQAVENSPWTKLSNAVAQQYLAAEAPAQALASGSQTQPAVQGAMSQALAEVGGGGGGGGWLGAQANAAQAATAPVQQAMGAMGAQYAKEAGPISQAVMAYGQANALENITAPESAWLNALASHVTSNLSYYGEIPTADVPVLQSAPGVVSALEQAGGYAGGSGGAGLTPLNALQVQNGQVQVNKNANALSGLGTVPGSSGGGNVPAPSSNAG